MTHSLATSLTINILVSMIFFYLVMFHLPRRWGNMSQGETRHEILRIMHAVEFVKYAVWVTVYSLSMVVAAPLVFISFGVSSVIRFETVRWETHAVLYNMIKLDSKEFDLYMLLVIPVTLLLAAIAISRFEKSFEKMEAIERVAKEE